MSCCCSTDGAQYCRSLLFWRLRAHTLLFALSASPVFLFRLFIPPSFYLSSANHVLPFIAWRVSLGLNWLYAFSLVLFVFSEGNRAHEANTLSRQAIHTPSRISAAGRLASSSRRLGNCTLRKQNKIQSLAFAAKSHCRKYKHHCIQSLSSGGVE